MVDREVERAAAHRAVDRQPKRAGAAWALVRRMPLNAQRPGVADEAVGLSVSATGPCPDRSPREDLSSGGVSRRLATRHRHHDGKAKSQRDRADARTAAIGADGCDAPSLRDAHGKFWDGLRWLSMDVDARLPRASFKSSGADDRLEREYRSTGNQLDRDDRTFPCARSVGQHGILTATPFGSDRGPTGPWLRWGARQLI
jgi:hypothetical protein